MSGIFKQGKNSIRTFFAILIDLLVQNGLVHCFVHSFVEEFTSHVMDYDLAGYCIVEILYSRESKEQPHARTANFHGKYQLRAIYRHTKHVRCFNIRERT